MKKLIILVLFVLSTGITFAQSSDIADIKKEVYKEFKSQIGEYIYMEGLDGGNFAVRLDSIYPTKKYATRLYFYDDYTKKTITVKPVIPIQELYLAGEKTYELKYDEDNRDIVVVPKD